MLLKFQFVDNPNSSSKDFSIIAKLYSLNHVDHKSLSDNFNFIVSMPLYFHCNLSIVTVLNGVFTILLVYVLTKSAGLKGLIWSINISSALLVISLFILSRNFIVKVSKLYLKKIFKYSFLIGVASISYYLYTKIDIIMLGSMGYLDRVSYYELINQVFLIVVVPFTVLGQVLAPQIAQLSAKTSGKEKVRKKFLTYLTIILPLGVLAAIIVHLLAIPVFNIIGGGQYDLVALMSLLNILLIILPLKCWGVFLTQGIVVPYGLAKITAIVTLIAGILNVILNYIFIKEFGFTGVFVSTVLTNIFSAFLTTYITWRKLHHEEMVITK